VIDGLSQQALAAKGSVVGTISTGVSVPKPSIAPYQPYTVRTLLAGAINGKKWMNLTTQANGASSWSPG